MDRIERLRQYIGNTRFFWWFVYEGDRLAVTAGLVVAAFVVYFGLGFLNIIFLPDNRLMWLFNGMVSGLLSLVTIVLTVNQLVLSQQFDSMGDLNDRLEQMIDFRQQAEGMTDTDVMPVQPGEFIAVLLATLSDRAQELGEDASEYDDDQLADEIDQYATDLTKQTDQIHEEVEDSDGTFAVLLIILDYNNSRHFYTARRLRTTYADSHSETTKTALDEIQELIKQINTTRQYFKTVYLQRELSELSRMIVYTGIIATLVVSIAILIFKDTATAGIDPALYHILLSGALVAIQLPVAILFSYAVRTATISRKTAAFGPFIPGEEQQQVGDEGGS
jgi:HAMP domain-containing protein